MKEGKFSDITLAEFKTLEGQMDAAMTAATTVQEFLAGTAGWRTGLYARENNPRHGRFLL